MANITVEKGARPKTNPPPRTNTDNSAPSIPLQRKEAVEGIGQLVGLGCIVTGQYADAGAISMHWPGISAEIAGLAEKNETIAKGVDALLQVGPYAGLVAAIMPLAFQLMANHKIISADKLAGAQITDPQVLEMQVKTQMSRQALEAMKAQKEAERELAQMHEEFLAEQNGQTTE